MSSRISLRSKICGGKEKRRSGKMCSQRSSYMLAMVEIAAHQIGILVLHYTFFIEMRRCENMAWDQFSWMQRNLCGKAFSTMEHRYLPEYRAQYIVSPWKDSLNCARWLLRTFPICCTTICRFAGLAMLHTARNPPSFRESLSNLVHKISYHRLCEDIT